MRFKRLAAYALTMGLVLTCLGGCGNSESGQKQEAGQDSGADSSSAGSKNAAGSTDPAVGESGSLSETDTSVTDYDGEIEEIIMAYPIIGNVNQNAAKEVEDGINAISEKQIGVHVTLKAIEIGSYAQQLNLMITSNEDLDVLVTYPSGSSSFSSMCSQNQLLPLNDLLEEYGQDAKANLGDLINATKMNGNIYSLTTYFNKAASPLVAMRTDILEKHGLLEQAKKVTCMQDLEPIYDVILEKEPTMSPVSAGMGGSIFSPAYVDMGAAKEDAVIYDSLGDNNYLVAVDYSSDTPTVYNHYASEAYKNSCMLAREWYEKGYIYKDSATTTDDADTLIRSGVVFSMIYKGGVDSPDAKRTTTGYDLTVVELNPIPISTGSCNVFTWGIPTTSKNPDAAMKFLNLMFSNADINNLLAWGVEGVHYQVLEDGTADYIQGQDVSSCQYHTVDFLYGDNFSILPWKGTSPDMRQQQLEAMNNAETSPYLGFTLDTTSLQNELTATTNVIEEFKAALENGTVDPETELPKFIEKLNASGAQKIVDEAQRQLDEWIAANK